MLDELIQFSLSSYQFVLTNLITVVSYPALSNQRIFWLYLLSSAILAFLVYQATNRSDPATGSSPKGFISFLFPRQVWETSSAWLDVRYFFFHQIVRLVIYGALLTGVLNLFFEIITAGHQLADTSQLSSHPQLSGIVISSLYMIVIIAFVDFVSYCIHYLQHKIPFLWEFHKVHHSLEVMQPLSNYREHPVDNIFYAVGTGVVYGIFMGLAYILFGYVPTMPQILGIPLLLFAFNILGYNLRHSHIWLRWPGRLSMMFASPAHHHIHHSCHPDHIDKNFAFVFPFWDVLFHTYHLPETNTDVKFGLPGNQGSEYKSCLGLYFIPCRNVLASSMKRLNRAFKRDAQQDSRS